jgi:hypothetical protein
MAERHPYAMLRSILIQLRLSKEEDERLNAPLDAIFDDQGPEHNSSMDVTEREH